MRAHWAELAARHPQLTFTPGDFRALGKPRVAVLHGLYRGREIRLDSFEQIKQEVDKGEVKYTTTRLVMAVGRSHDNIDQRSGASPQDDDPIPLETVSPLLTQTDLSFLRGEIRLEEKGGQLYHEQRRIETEVDYLQRLLDTLSNLADTYAQILASGGESVPSLLDFIDGGDPALQQTAGQLLQGIAQDTDRRLSDQLTELVCLSCMARLGAHKAALSRWQTVTYYGCRRCGQSRYYRPARVVARLDRAMATAWVEQANEIQVNWLQRRALFDFDAVAIIQASDEEVERFAVQVGNDTDPLRRPRYSAMRCIVAADCELSENTLRVLGRVFGEVEEVG